jgi:hypothetical protein
MTRAVESSKAKSYARGIDEQDVSRRADCHNVAISLIFLKGTFGRAMFLRCGTLCGKFTVSKPRFLAQNPDTGEA